MPVTMLFNVTDDEVPLADLQLGGPDMLIDGYDQYNPRQDQDVVNITPDDASEEPPSGAEPLADDFEAMKARVLGDLGDLEAEAETYHTWHIDKWRSLPKKEHGPVFQCGGHPWRVLIFPFGNNVECVSLYLEHGFDGEPPADWYVCVQFTLVLWNPSDPSLYTTHHANHRFNSKEGDWGFTRFVELRKAFNTPFHEGTRPLIDGEEAKITAYVRVIKDETGVLWHNFEGYDSKKETGMVGLKNQGATCYLNSLLQSLYFTNAFRKAVYQIPTESEAVRTNHVYTLQRLFFRLQKDKFAVSTNELTASFGWDSRQIFEQQDVQELSRILMEKLEERMKGTAAEHALPRLFIGKSKTYISCINVSFESSRIEDFWDVQLNVRGSKTLHESFIDYIQVETLEGENKYDAGEPYKLQDAKKGVIFESFPPVLHLQLKRFEYDINRDAMMKVNDRHEFPEEFDAAPYLAPEVDKSEPWTYQLHGVLVHSGDIGAGHYYAFLKPTKDGFFYKFDDDRVTRATMKEVLEENYGGEYANIANGGLGQRQPYMRGYSTKRSMNAYMLVYIRKSRLDEVLFEVKETDIPPHIEKRISDEQAELARRRKEREEQHLYQSIGVISDQSFREHHTFDLTDYESDRRAEPSAPNVHRVLKTTRTGEFAAEIAQELGVDDDQVRFWVMVGRQNKTNRPDQPIRDQNLTIEEVQIRHGSKGKSFFLWVETCAKGEDGKVQWPEATTTTGGNVPLLVFLKHFDAPAQTLTGIGHVYVKKNAKVGDIIPHICEIMKWDSSTNVVLYEEIKFSMIEQMKTKNTFAASEIQDGDIICFQRITADEDMSNVPYHNPKEYYDYLLNRIPVSFYPRPSFDGEPFVLNLSKKMTYEQFSAQVGDHLKVDPTHLRFATITTQNKFKAFVKRGMNQNLHQILATQYSSYGYNQHRSDALFYEILETSLADFETKKSIKVVWLPEGIVKEEQIDVLVAKNGTVNDLLAGIARKLQLDPATTPPTSLRVIEVSGSKVHKELHPTFSITTLSDMSGLFAEKMPEEEANAPADALFVYAYHFDKEPTKPHGIPFKFLLKETEEFKDTRERISKRSGIKGKLLQQIKFCAVGRGVYGKARYLEDTDVLYGLVTPAPEGMGEPNVVIEQLGLDHVNKNRGFWGKAENMFIK